MRPAPMSYERRAELVADGSRDITLDGEPAFLAGSMLDFCKVYRRDRKGGSVEFAWPTVERILSTHRKFQS